MTRAPHKPYSIRYARLDDAARIRTLLIESWHAAYDPILSPKEVDGHCRWLFSEPMIECYVRDTALKRLYVAETEGRLAGLAQCGISITGRLIVYMLYVHPDYQRRGIGRELMTYCAGSFAWANSLAVEVLEPNTSAIAFYETLGMTKAGAMLNPSRASVPIAYMYRDLFGSVSRWTAFRQFLRLSIGRAPLPMVASQTTISPRS